jgi:hypothetical protein
MSGVGRAQACDDHAPRRSWSASVTGLMVGLALHRRSRPGADGKDALAGGTAGQAGMAQLQQVVLGHAFLSSALAARRWPSRPCGGAVLHSAPRQPIPWNRPHAR